MGLLVSYILLAWTRRSSSRFDVLEDITDYQFLESIIVMLPAEIVKLPTKQRRALLIDLANRMHFGVYPTPLQRAFLEVGIQLQDYQQALPEDPVELSRHRSLVSIAYKRIANLQRCDKVLSHVIE